MQDGFSPSFSKNGRMIHHYIGDVDFFGIHRAPGNRAR